MAGGFRHQLPSARREWVRRHRLVERLRRRFDVSVTVVVAPAGYGKTVAISQAVGATADDPTRIDVWLRCAPTDADPAEFAAAVLASISEATGRTFSASGDDVTAVTDALANLGPARVCLVLDDVHVVEPADHLAELVRHLPANAHLVLSGRSLPTVDLLARELVGSVDRLTEHDLAFDDEELMALYGEPVVDVDDTHRWPALVALELGSGTVGPIEFLLAEVATTISSEHRPALAALAHLDEIDDDDVLAATRGQLTANELLGDLPLVHRSGDDTFRLHDLWRESFAAAPPDAETADALERVAGVRLRHDPVEAAALYAAADRADGVELAVLAAAEMPPVNAAVGGLRRLGMIAADLIGERPAADLIVGSVVHAGDEIRSAERFADTARRAREAGDETVEALALLHEFNMRWIVDPSDIPAALFARAERLADRGHRSAHLVATMQRVATAQGLGADADALTALADLTPPTNDWERVYHAFGLIDLGRPELVVLPEHDSGVTAAAVGLGGQHLAHALWLRGAVDPESALAFGRELGALSDDHQVPHVNVSTHAVLAVVATAAGATAVAREHADRALCQSALTASRTARVHARVADAIVTLDQSGDDQAAERLDRILTELPIDRWPPRPYLNVLAAVYALVPRTRPSLDRISVGPAMATALDAGRALVALRERGDPSPATALPWHDTLTLRAHVVPAHLSELAAAAAAAGNGQVGVVLSQLPDVRRHVADVSVRHRHGPTAAWATEQSRLLPARPEHELRISTLGAMSLHRSATEVVDADWTGRARVRQLLAHLVHHRKTSRQRIVDDLWPGLDTTKALHNLRVNLAHLQRVLQPERQRDDPPWFVRSTEQTITLVDECVVVDVDEFEDTHRRARALDDRGRSTEAAALYRKAVDLYRGEYLEELPEAAWAEMERARLHALALGAQCRLGELLLARGEPEEAARHAADVLRTEPLHERAARLLAEALAAQGDRVAARRSLDGVLARLTEQRLRPEHATAKLAERLGRGE